MTGIGGEDVWIGCKPPILETRLELRFFSPGFHGCQSVPASDSLSESSSYSPSSVDDDAVGVTSVDALTADVPVVILAIDVLEADGTCVSTRGSD
jgi:hypothetical protein